MILLSIEIPQEHTRIHTLCKNKFWGLPKLRTVPVSCSASRCFAADILIRRILWLGTVFTTVATCVVNPEQLQLFVEGQFIWLGDHRVRPLWASSKIAYIGSLVWQLDQSTSKTASAQRFHVVFLYKQIFAVICHLLRTSNFFFRSVGKIPFNILQIEIISSNTAVERCKSESESWASTYVKFCASDQ